MSNNTSDDNTVPTMKCQLVIVEAKILEKRFKTGMHILNNSEEPLTNWSDIMPKICTCMIGSVHDVLIRRRNLYKL